MNRPTDPLFDQRIADWLEDGPTQAPAHVLDTVLAALPSIPRRRASHAPWRLQTTPRSIRWFVAAAAVIGVLAVGGVLYLLQAHQPLVGKPSEAPRPTAAIVPPRVASWTATGNMVTPHYGHTATLLPDGMVLVAGGLEGSHGIAAAELYDPGTGRWTATGSMVRPRYLATATLLTNGTVLVAGGNAASSAELYDPSTRTWTATGNMVTSRSLHTATLLADGKVLVAGGDQDSGAVAATAELYDPGTGTWTATKRMVTPRRSHSATLLNDGKVLVAGGFDAIPTTLLTSGISPEEVATAELYDPFTGTWAATGSMATPRSSHTATLLPDGTVLVAGRGNPERYDPGSGTWTIEGIGADLGVENATLLGDGTVLVTFDGFAADLYDPRSGSWVAAATPTTVVTAGATATLLHDGTVLVAGGDDRHKLVSAELYHPASTRAVPDGPMTAGRYQIDVKLFTSLTGTYDDPGSLARVTFDVPAGWSGNGRAIRKGGGTSPGGVGMAPWTISSVNLDPCHTSTSDHADPLLMQYLDGLPTALTTWWEGASMPGAPVATEKTRAKLAGLPGWYVELRAPTNLDFAKCDGGKYTPWTSADGGQRSLEGPGELDRLRIVKVAGSHDPQAMDGGLLVIDAHSLPGTSATDLAELQTIVDSMKIEVTTGQ